MVSMGFVGGLTDGMGCSLRRIVSAGRPVIFTSLSSELRSLQEMHTPV